MKLSIVIPCYNEEKNISLILKKFNEIILRDDIEVIFSQHDLPINDYEIRAITEYFIKS